MVVFRGVFILFTVLGTSASGHAQDKYQVSDAERVACQDDAVRLCSTAYPDEDALLTCMRANVAKLTRTCHSTFVAGLQKRGLQ